MEDHRWALSGPTDCRRLRFDKRANRTTVQMFESPENGFCGWSFWTWKRAPGHFPGLVTIKLPSDWRAVIDWTGAWSGRKPNREQAVTGLGDFSKAVRFENCELDQQMLDALQPKGQQVKPRGRN
jgi:hypothetical protein